MFLVCLPFSNFRMPNRQRCTATANCSFQPCQGKTHQSSSNISNEQKELLPLSLSLPTQTPIYLFSISHIQHYQRLLSLYWRQFVLTPLFISLHFYQITVIRSFFEWFSDIAFCDIFLHVIF